MGEGAVRVEVGRDLVAVVDNVLEAANGLEAADRGAGAGRVAQDQAEVHGPRELASA